MKIRSRLLIFNLTMISATAAILGTTFFVFAEQYLHILALREISATSRQAVNVVEQFFELRLAEQKTLSRSTFFFRELHYDQIESRFNDYRNNFQFYQSISFYGPDRVRRIDLNRTDLGEPGSPRHLFDEAERSDEPVYMFEFSNPLRPSFFIVSRVKQPGGRLIGFVSATVPLIYLQQGLSGLSDSTLGHVRADVQIFSSDGIRIFSKMDSQGISPQGVMMDSLADLERRAKAPPEALAQSTPDDTESAKFIETANTFTALFKKRTPGSEARSWALAYRVPKEDINYPITLLRYMVVSLFIGLIALTYFLNRWLSDSLLYPIEAMTALIKSFDLSAPASQIHDTRTAALRERGDEIGYLSRGLSEMMERLRANFAELSSAAKFAALGEMAAGIAHEINNPLTVILGKAALLEKSAEKSADKNSEGHTDQSHQKADTIRESTQKIIEMVNRISKTILALRVYSRSGDHDPIGAETVKTIIDSTLDICYERLRLASIDIQTDIKPEDAVILARPVQVSQILMNLLNNAHDAITSQPEMDPANKWIKVVVRETASHVEVAVLNGGPRIADDVAEHLFDPFFTTKPIGLGTGIGLTISQRLARANGAELIYDRSSPATRFCLVFPRADLDLDRTPHPKT